MTPQSVTEDDGHRRSDSHDALKSAERDQTAADRDEAAQAQDRSAADRDQRSESRDQRAEAREVEEGQADVEGASDRSAARRDRKAAAGDRKSASDDRDAARADRARAAADHAAQLLDGLTGAYRREAGFLELEREVAKAQRTQVGFVLAFIDVDHLKHTNDSLGHDFGDQRLAQVAKSVRADLRAYDVLVRYGGDEFLCGIAGMSLDDAAARFERVNVDLTEHDQGSISVGLAQLEPGEGIVDLIVRADTAMYATREKA